MSNYLGLFTLKWQHPQCFQDPHPPEHLLHIWIQPSSTKVLVLKAPLKSVPHQRMEALLVHGYVCNAIFNLYSVPNFFNVFHYIVGLNRVDLDMHHLWIIVISRRKWVKLNLKRLWAETGQYPVQQFRVLCRMQQQVIKLTIYLC